MAKQEKRMVKIEIYLWRKCARAKQEGLIFLANPSNKKHGKLDIDYLDDIPRKIREHLEKVGLAYDVGDDDMTVIEPKTRKRQVVRKVRRGDE